MTGQATMRMNRPTWVDLSSTDAAGSRDFYGDLFGWDIQVSDDPQYGGYAIAKIDGGDVAGIGGQQMPGAPTVWNIYIGTPDAAALGDKVSAAGGTVIAPAFDVGDQGRIVVFQDPAGAFLSAWQPGAMSTFTSDRANSYAWAELNTRDGDASIRFLEQVFGWTHRTSETGGGPDYTEMQLNGESIAGVIPMNEMFPPEVPSYWMAYFGVEDVDAKYAAALGAGAREMVPPQDFPGGRFAIVTDPQGGMFGLLKMREG
jgi:predicted enzyme related to lactoylglutathione lyase